MLRIEPFRVLDHIDAAKALLEEHWEELAKHKHLMVLNPDREMYKRLEPLTVALGLFDGDMLVGYSVNFFAEKHPHYAGLSVLQNDVLFVSKELRGTVGLRLIRATEAAAKERGARLMVWHAKEGTGLDAMLPRLGYGVQDILYAKEIT